MSARQSEGFRRDRGGNSGGRARFPELPSLRGSVVRPPSHDEAEAPVLDGDRGYGRKRVLVRGLAPRAGRGRRDSNPEPPVLETSGISVNRAEIRGLARVFAPVTF